MITFKINGESKQIPSTWDEVTFDQYIKLFDKADSIGLVSIFTGIDYDTLKKAIIVGVDRLYETISFINKPPQFPGSVDKCGPYTIPNNTKGAFDIRFESLAQFEDMRQVMKKVPKDNIKAHTEAYAEYVAIYLQKIRDGEYDSFKSDIMVEEIRTYPAYQVITLGSFFFLKLANSFNGSRNGSQTTTPPRKKAKRASTSFQKRSGRSLRSSKRR